MAAPSDDAGPEPFSDDEPGLDESLVPFAPTSPLSVAANSLVPIGLGVAAIVFAPVVVRIEVTTLRWAIPILASLVIALGLAIGIVGIRAFATFAEPDIVRYMRIQVVGLWLVSLGFLVTGVLAASATLVFFGAAFSLSLRFVVAQSSSRRGSAANRVLRRLWPAFVAECVFVIVATPIAAVVSTQVALPDDVSARFIADAFILPIAAAVALVLLLRSRRRWAKADDAAAAADDTNSKDGANTPDERPSASAE
ncbi:hypothetical protein AS850_07715 [Frondihabitans sp. 762G35]|uniref:hypothetical protein n=1 Tax=Frondihabitans sp. 762G35 TaxID=1446794 RepID=UPI000D208CCB|nr:hypothetical protein [Frondihabitans sp. 762G35]ARC56964.1 hypothetical protein AS850_07715 [Frondihabitans sp. 762G35]